MTLFRMSALALAASLALTLAMGTGPAHAQPANAKPALDTRSGPTPAAAAAEEAAARARRIPGDHIAVVVNSEVVTAGEIAGRAERLRDEARRSGQPAPDLLSAREAAREQLIEERVLVTYARDSGARVDEPELDRVVANVAVQNRLTMPQLIERLKADGIDVKRFRENMRDQMLQERVRDREVVSRIRVTDGEIDTYLEERQAAARTNAPLNIAQILVPVPSDASAAEREARKQKATLALTRVRSGENFTAVSKELSDDANRDRGGEIGLRAANRLPDLFVKAVANLAPGQVSPELVVSEAGYHVLKLIERQASADANVVTETRARHILLRPSDRLPPEQVARRLAEAKRAIEAGRAKFEDLAKEYSEDGTAANGGDLGWAPPGNFVPEFEAAMDALPLNGISEPVQSRFGIHLIQVLERRETKIDPQKLRDQARGVLRERKFETAYKEWVKDLRDKAFVELRDTDAND
jgi:peptidyl-prolyl cis-trans isomerase SurA